MDFSVTDSGGLEAGCNEGPPRAESRVMDAPEKQENQENTAGEDMEELMSKLALIRAEVESEKPDPRLPNRLLALVGLLAVLVLFLSLLTGPCGLGLARADAPMAELKKRVYHAEPAGDVLFSAVEYGLMTWDISRSGPPAFLGQMEIPGSAVSVTLRDQIALVCAGPRGLYLVDASDPGSLKLLGHLDTPGAANQVVVSKFSAYLADGSMGTAILDLRDPRVPRETGRLKTADYVRGLALEGDRLLTAEDRGGLRIWNLAGRRGPVLQATIPIPGQARGVVVHGGRAYVAAGTAGLSTVEIRPGRKPQVMVTVPTEDTARGLAILRDRYLLVADGSAGVKVFDLIQPAGSPWVSRISDMEGNVTRVTTDGDRAFLAVDYRGIRIIDVTDPLVPKNLWNGD